MTTEHYESIIENAIHYYGKVHQQVKAIEELGELITSLARHLNSNGTVYADHVREEIADVAIILPQLSRIFGPAEVDAFVEKKLTRLHNRMKNEFGENYATKKREVEGSSLC
jgi:NTP pyrophosphatase (non-canonical NTP hydrolase)